MVNGGLIVASVIGAAGVGISALALPFVSPAFRRVCIPFVPASDVQINNVKRLLSLVPRPVDPIIDLGSGDGRVVSYNFVLGVHCSRVILTNYSLYSVFSSTRSFILTKS